MDREWFPIGTLEDMERYGEAGHRRQRNDWAAGTQSYFFIIIIMGARCIFSEKLQPKPCCYK